MKKLTKRYIYAGILATIVIVVMYVVGMSDVINFSPPFDIGFNQYIDIKAGVIGICFLVIGFIIWFLTFKKDKRL